MRRIRRLASALLAVFRAAPAAAHTEGALWYLKARRVARTIARVCGVTQAQAAGVIAALSPRLQWVANVRAAGKLCAGVIPSGVFRANLTKAKLILSGVRPLSVLRGPKVRAFYRAIMGDESAAVVDVWTARAAGLTRIPTDRDYRDVSAALAHVAAFEGITVARVQATAWVAVRGRA